MRDRIEQDLGVGDEAAVPEGVLRVAGGGVRHPQGPGQGEGSRGDAVCGRKMDFCWPYGPETTESMDKVDK